MTKPECIYIYLTEPDASSWVSGGYTPESAAYAEEVAQAIIAINAKETPKPIDRDNPYGKAARANRLIPFERYHASDDEFGMELLVWDMDPTLIDDGRSHYIKQLFPEAPWLQIFIARGPGIYSHFETFWLWLTTV